MATIGGGEGIPPDILRQAAAWFASLTDATADDVERARWRKWVDAHPDNARAWRRVEEVMGQLAPFAHAGDSVRGALAAPRRNRRRVLGALGVLAAVGAGAAVSRLPWRQWRDEAAMARADYHAGMGKVATTVLPDGTRIWLGSLGVLDLDYGPALRRLHLYRGDLLVETALDRNLPARPFLVDTPHGRLRALGTRFAVRADPLQSQVDVYEGAVELTPAETDRSVHVLHAGERAVFNRRDLVDVGPASTMREAWTRGMLVADRMRLQDLVSELARWNATPIACDPAVAGLQVVGAFPLHDPDRILEALAGSLPVRIVREEGRRRIVADATRQAASPAIPFDSLPRRIE
jgi:transmembrane sensor